MGVTYAAIDRFLLTGEGEEADLAIIDRSSKRSEHKRTGAATYQGIKSTNTAREGGVFLRSIPIPMCFVGATIGRPEVPNRRVIANQCAHWCGNPVDFIRVSRRVCRGGALLRPKAPSTKRGLSVNG